MPRKRVILELGSGNDLHGGDYTKAANRAVQDALHHSSLAMLRSLGIDPKTQMFVEVTIGVQQPDKVDTEAVKATLPHGIVTVKGGQRRSGCRRSGAWRQRGDRIRGNRGAAGTSLTSGRTERAS